MGTTASKRNFKGSPSYAAPEALTADEQKQGEQGDKGKPAEDNKSKEELGKLEIMKWKPFLIDIVKLDKTKDFILQDSIKKANTELYKKGIKVDHKLVTDFVNATDQNMANDILLFLGIDNSPPPVKDVSGVTIDSTTAGGGGGDPPAPADGGGDPPAPAAAEGAAPAAAEGAAPAAPDIQGQILVDPKGNPIKFDREKAESMADGDENAKHLKPDVRDENLKPMVQSIIDATEQAKKHLVFRKILEEYVTESDKFKAEFKDENINETKAEIKAGTEDAATDGKEKNKNKANDNQSDGGQEGGDNSSMSGGSYNSSMSGGSYNSSMSGGSYNSSMSGGSYNSSMSGGSEYSGGDNYSLGGDSNYSGMSGGSEYSGGRVGRIWRNSEEKKEDKIKDIRKKEYKSFKKETKAEFKRKQDLFFGDMIEFTKFMDDETNSKNLIKLIYSGKIPGKWVDKSHDTKNAGPKIELAQALVKAINEYNPEGEAAPAAPEGEEGAAGEGEGEGEGAAPAPEEGAAAPVPEGVEKGASGEGVAIQTGGAAAEAIVKKQPHKHKKKMTRRKNKNKNINISINIGNQNDTSDSDTSDSDTSDSDSDKSDSDTSDSDTSDNEEQGEKKYKKKYKRKGKYTINPQKNNKTTRRRKNKE